MIRINTADIGPDGLNVSGTEDAAFMELEYSNGEIVPFKIFDVTFEKGTSNADFGIITDQKKYLKIAINGGFIAVNALQMSGKRKNSTENFLIGNNVTNCKLVTKKKY